MKEPTRKPGGLKSIKGTMAQLMVRQGYAQVQSADDCQRAWKEAVGDKLAPFTQAGNVSRGCLLVIVSDSAVCQAISFQKSQILASLQSLLPDHGINDLKIKVGRID